MLEHTVVLHTIQLSFEFISYFISTESYIISWTWILSIINFFFLYFMSSSFIQFKMLGSLVLYNKFLYEVIIRSWEPLLSFIYKYCALHIVILRTYIFGIQWDLDIGSLDIDTWLPISPKSYLSSIWSILQRHNE